PAERAARRDAVLDDVDVGGALSREPGLPVLGHVRVRIDVGQGLGFQRVECANGEYGAGDAEAGCGLDEPRDRDQAEDGDARCEQQSTPRASQDGWLRTWLVTVL